MKTPSAFLTLVLVGVATIAMTTGCSTKDTSTDKVQVTADAAMDAETLAQAGEQLVTPYTYMLADKVFDMSLAKDPTNIRAQFYKSMLKAPMTLKGVLNRVTPFVNKYGDPKQFAQMADQIPNSPARDFFMSGSQDIQTVTDLQTLLVQYRDALNDFRTFLKNNPDIQLSLNLNPLVVASQIQNDPSRNCVVTNNTDSNVSVVCDYRKVAQRVVNGADEVILSQLTSGEILYLTMYTSYSAEGLADLSKLDPDSLMTPKAKQAFLEANPAFGKLRSDNALTQITQLGADLSAAWKYAQKNQATLCPLPIVTNVPPEAVPYGQSGDYQHHYGSAPKQRPGYLFEDGVCTGYFSTESQKYLGVLDQVLSSAYLFPVVHASDAGTTSQMVKVDAFKLARNPVADLRSIAPASFSACGTATSLRDKTLGGMFPDGNAELLLDQRSCQK